MITKFFRASSSHSVLALLAVATLMPSPVQAQVHTPSLFVPVSPWSVGSTELAQMRGLQDVKLPCVMSNEFDNGYILRLSGGGGQMLAMAVDFRQNAFQQGRKYPASISIDDAYMKQASGAAIAPGALVFSLRELDGFYAALKGGKVMELNVQGNAFQFSLQDLNASFAALEQCYAGEKTTPIAPVQATTNAHNKTPPAVIVPAVEVEPLPKSFNDILKADTGAQPRNITALPMRISRAEDATTSPATPANVAQNDVYAAPVSPRSILWKAKAGEDIQTVLSRWASSAGYDLEWRADNGGRVAQDVSLNGNFEQAVSQLLAETDAAGGIHGRFENDPVPQNAPSSGTAKWSGAAGANIQTVLEGWAQRENVYIVWQDYMSIPLKSGIAESGTFEQALLSLLGQYDNDAARPVARLNTDPATGQRTLLMNLDKTS